MFAAYDLYNSDTAIHILMAQSLHFPDSFYYWGQNSLGSLVPMLSYPFVSILPLPPIVTVSMIQLVLLALTWWFFAQSVRSVLAQIMLGLVVFLPPFVFAEASLVGQPFTGQLFLLGASIYLFRKAEAQGDAKLIFLFAGLSAGLGLWLAELHSLVLVGTGLYFLVRTSKLDLEKRWPVSFSWDFKWRTRFTPILWGLLVAFVFVIIAKAINHNLAYEGPLISTQLGESFALLFEKLWNSLSFGVFSLWTSLFTWLGLISFGLLTYHAIKAPKLTLGVTLVLTGVLVTLYCAMSNWVFINQLLPRHFSLAYILIAIGGILFLNQESKTEDKKTALPNYILTATLIVGALSLVLRQGVPSLEGAVFYSQSEPFKALSPSVVLGDYSVVYAVAGTNPANISPISIQNGVNRMPWNKDLIFAGLPTYFFETNYKNKLDTVESYAGYQFVKTGPTVFVTGAYRWAPYRLSLVNKTYLPQDLGHQIGQEQPDPAAETGKAWVTDASSIQNPGFVVFGPYLPLDTGSYVAKFRVRTPRGTTETYPITFDVVGNGGQFMIGQNKVPVSSLAADGYSQIEVPFRVTASAGLAHEFRVYNNTGVPLYFEKLKVEQQIPAYYRDKFRK